MKRLLQVLHALLVIAMILALSLVAFNRSDAKILGVLGKDAKAEGSIKVTTRMSYSALVKLAKISLLQAIAKAQKRVPGTVIEAELEVEHRYLIYEVEIITSAGEILEVIVDAGNGRILGKMLDDDVLEGGAMGDDNDNGDKGDDDDNWEDGQGNDAAEKQ